MRIIALILMLYCSSTFADPVSECDKPGAPADIPGTSYCIRTAGEPAPIPGRLLSFDENRRRGKSDADAKGTLSFAEQNGVLLPKVLVGTLLGALAAEIIFDIVIGSLLATHKL